MSWTDERIATLKKMWKDGKSAAEIAKTLGKGVTRNAVIGKAHRMGLSGRPSPIKENAVAPAASASAKKEPAVRGKKQAVPPSAPKGPKKSAPVTGPVRNHGSTRGEVTEPRKMPVEAIPPGGGVALIDLTERMCKWPIGDPRSADFTFCGRGIRPGTPYCPEHAAAAYQSSSRSRALHSSSSAAANQDKHAVEEVEEEVIVEDEDEDEDEDEEEAVS